MLGEPFRCRHRRGRLVIRRGRIRPPGLTNAGQHHQGQQQDQSGQDVIKCPGSITWGSGAGRKDLHSSVSSGPVNTAMMNMNQIT